MWGEDWKDAEQKTEGVNPEQVTGRGGGRRGGRRGEEGGRGGGRRGGGGGLRSVLLNTVMGTP